MSAYRVLIVITHPKVKSQWWTDGETFKSIHEARRHRRDVVAPKWSDCDTAICRGSEVLFYEDSLAEKRAFAECIA